MKEASITTRTLDATCHCRTSTLSFTVPTASLPIPAHFCHCSICRHATGTYFTAGAAIPEPVIDTSTFTTYKSSEHLTRWFCSTCGAHMLATVQLTDETKWYVSAPSVDAEEEVWDFASHVYVRGTGDGGLATLMSQIGGKEIGVWRELSGRSAPWHCADPASKYEIASEQRDDQLHARCHCGGIEFNVSRPTGDETFTEIDESNVRKYKEKWLAIHDVCNSCRLTISAFVVSWFFPSRDHITLANGSPYPDDGIFGTARAYKSSAGVDRTFCSTCGAAVSYVTEERSHVVDIAAGLLRTSDARAEDWLEWRTYKLAFEEDAVWTNVRDALKEGLQKWK
ncbi:hypothetical protein EKO04_004309 [Ascochyta lentis]|uniref:CENP-V/GFA domain-containing protein n=1 Tax=Ascochyta lentis TaxID=205686 RepID=A0A8H7MIK4_9PLEO|nr:hypothetical protein EKO04_004309 [Ascochyta lentis]